MAYPLSVLKRNNDMYEETAGGVGLKQWKSMTPYQKTHYLKIHPNSMYAEKFRQFKQAILQKQKPVNFHIEKHGDKFSYKFTVGAMPIFQGANFDSALDAGRDFVSMFPQDGWITPDSAVAFLEDIKKQFGE